MFQYISEALSDRTTTVFSVSKFQQCFPMEGPRTPHFLGVRLSDILYLYYSLHTTSAIDPLMITNRLL